MAKPADESAPSEGTGEQHRATLVEVPSAWIREAEQSAAAVPPPPAPKPATKSKPVEPTMVRETATIGPGTVLGKYRLVRQLSADERGLVYEAAHISIGRSFALKTMSPHLATVPKAVARFMREASLASRLNHPHVVAWNDFGTDSGVMYLVMELLSGEPLSALLARERNVLPPANIADILLAVCAGVYAAHQSGVIHRDLRPENIVLSRSSLGEIVPKVVNFGWSRVMNEDPTTVGLHSGGMVVGSMTYLSPEQVTNATVGVASDQYSLGVILYEALTGRRPNDGETVAEVVRNITNGTAPRPRLFRSELPDEFEAVVMKAMATNPADRFESVMAMGRALLPFASPKRMVMWEDYYQSGGAAAVAPAESGGMKGLGAQTDRGSTAPLQVPAEFTPSRARQAAERPSERRASEDRSPARKTSDRKEPRARSSSSSRAVSRGTSRRGAGGSRVFLRLGLLAIVGAAAAGVILVRRDPRLNSYVPAPVRGMLDGAAALWENPQPSRVDVSRAAEKPVGIAPQETSDQDATAVVKPAELTRTKPSEKATGPIAGPTKAAASAGLAETAPKVKGRKLAADKAAGKRGKLGNASKRMAHRAGKGKRAGALSPRAPVGSAAAPATDPPTDTGAAAAPVYYQAPAANPPAGYGQQVAPPAAQAPDRGYGYAAPTQQQPQQPAQQQQQQQQPPAQYQAPPAYYQTPPANSPPPDYRGYPPPATPR